MSVQKREKLKPGNISKRQRCIGFKKWWALPYDRQN